MLLYIVQVKCTIVSNMEGNTATRRKQPETQVLVIRRGSHRQHSGEGKAVLRTVDTPTVHLFVQSAGLGIARSACVKKKEGKNEKKANHCMSLRQLPRLIQHQMTLCYWRKGVSCCFVEMSAW